MIIAVNALSYPWYCLTTDQLFHRRATQTNETNIVNETLLVLRIPTGGRQTSWLFTSAAEGFTCSLPPPSCINGYRWHTPGVICSSEMNNGRGSLKNTYSCIVGGHMMSWQPYCCTKNYEMTGILLHQANSVGFETFSYVNSSSCSNQFWHLLDTWVKMLYKMFVFWGTHGS